MPYFRDYVKAMDIISGDTEGDIQIYLYLAIISTGIPGNAFMSMELPFINAEMEADFGNQIKAELNLEVYASNTTNIAITLPSLSVEAEAEIHTVTMECYLPNLQVDAYLIFNPWMQVTLPELQVEAEGNPNRVYELCIDTNQGI